MEDGTPMAREALPTGLGLGAVAGVVAGGCMTAFHAMLKRAGWIDRMSPEAVVEWVGDRTGKGPESRLAYVASEEALHLVYAAGWGAIFGALTTRRAAPAVLGGALFGIGIWAMNFPGVLPALGIAAGPRASRRPQTAASIAAHLVFGLATELALREFRARPAPSATADRTRRRRRIA